MLSNARTIKNNGQENQMVITQIANNTREQALLCDFSQAVEEAILDSHKAQEAPPSTSSDQTVLTSKVTHVRDGDTIEVNGIPVRLAALDCPERNTKDGDYATELAKQFEGLQATCGLTGAKTYDRLVGYCSINGTDFGAYMMQNSTSKVREKYDVWNRY